MPEPIPFDVWRHRYAVTVVIAATLLLAAGGLVTSTGSGLAVPDWPLSFGQVFPPMTGGVLFEHGHRLVAASVGILTLVLAGWFARREARPWVRRLALLAVAAVIVQGLLGGLTVLLHLPPAVSILHACVAQAFFGMLVVLALGTSRSFVAGSAPPIDGGGAALRTLAVAATALVYGQLVLGAIVRHTGAGLAIPDFPLALGRIVPPFLSLEIVVHFAHRVGALLAGSAVVAASVVALRRHRDRDDLRRPAIAALLLLPIQMALGATAVLTRLAVLPATAHVVAGALLLGASLVLAVNAARTTAPSGRRVPLPRTQVA